MSSFTIMQELDYVAFLANTNIFKSVLLYLLVVIFFLLFQLRVSLVRRIWKR